MKCTFGEKQGAVDRRWFSAHSIFVLPGDKST